MTGRGPVACVCGRLNPITDTDGDRTALEPGVCACGHYLYLHYGDRTIDQ